MGRPKMGVPAAFGGSRGLDQEGRQEGCLRGVVKTRPLLTTPLDDPHVVILGLRTRADSPDKRQGYGRCAFLLEKRDASWRKTTRGVWCADLGPHRRRSTCVAKACFQWLGRSASIKEGGAWRTIRAMGAPGGHRRPGPQRRPDNTIRNYSTRYTLRGIHAEARRGVFLLERRSSISNVADEIGTRIRMRWELYDESNLREVARHDRHARREMTPGLAPPVEETMRCRACVNTAWRVKGTRWMANEN